jgi:hypothetical protein
MALVRHEGREMGRMGLSPAPFVGLLSEAVQGLLAATPEAPVVLAEV